MEIIFTLDAPQVIQLVVAVILPILVGLVTNRVTSSGKKAVLLAALSTLSALLTSLLAANERGEAYDLGAGLVAALATFLVAVAMHYGLWKPTGVTPAAQASTPLTIIDRGRKVEGRPYYDPH